MSDITYSRRAEEALDRAHHVNAVGDAPVFVRAQINATLAVARAAQQIYDVVKYADRSSDRLVDGPVDWITWEHDGRLTALSVRSIQGFSDDGQGGSVVSVTGLPDAVSIPLSYGTIASMVGVV